MSPARRAQMCFGSGPLHRAPARTAPAAAAAPLPPPGARPSAWGGAAALGQGVGREVGQDKQRPQSRSAVAPPAHTAERCNNSPGPPPPSKGPSSARRGGSGAGVLQALRAARPCPACPGLSLWGRARSWAPGTKAPPGLAARTWRGRASLATPPFAPATPPLPRPRPLCPSRSLLPPFPPAPPLAHPRQ